QAVYMAPTKALCSERCKDWQKKFRTLGVTCNELTGDSNGYQMQEIQRSQIIVTTPEKWDSTTRKWRDHKSLMGFVRLFLIDEVHTLNEPGRGATLEVVVSRMQTVSLEMQRESGGSSTKSRLRILALSATVPNIQDVGNWLRDPAHGPATIRVFGEEFRPVQLHREVLAFHGGEGGNKGAFAFEK
ncbi:P-loop containing nucleoside triphosphate hydrolase protein, partial [Blyttiomyces helicus]